jgi:hypothetical protein
LESWTTGVTDSPQYRKGIGLERRRGYQARRDGLQPLSPRGPRQTAPLARFPRGHASYLRGELYNREKNVVGVNPHSFPQNEGTAQTAERLAEQYKVSRATIERDGHEFLAVAVVLLVGRWYEYTDYYLRSDRALDGSGRVHCGYLGRLSIDRWTSNTSLAFSLASLSPSRRFRLSARL